MVRYPDVEIARFVRRDNRFIAICYLPNVQKEVVVHVKNTGRCKELLHANVEVAVSYQKSPTRKTDYDLIAVKKDGKWVNIDSQVPNQLAFDGIRQGVIILPGLHGQLKLIKREVTFDASRFDVYLETTTGQKAIIEVKGMTLENNKIVAFPDAPTERGLKHVKELNRLSTIGYLSYILFIIQLEDVKIATINERMQPLLKEEIKKGQSMGLNVVAFSCLVTPDTIELAKPVPFDLEELFVPVD